MVEEEENSHSGGVTAGGFVGVRLPRGLLLLRTEQTRPLFGQVSAEFLPSFPFLSREMRLRCVNYGVASYSTLSNCTCNLEMDITRIRATLRTTAPFQR